MKAAVFKRALAGATLKEVADACGSCPPPALRYQSMWLHWEDSKDAIMRSSMMDRGMQKTNASSRFLSVDNTLLELEGIYMIRSRVRDQEKTVVLVAGHEYVPRKGKIQQTGHGFDLVQKGLMHAKVRYIDTSMSSNLLCARRC